MRYLLIILFAGSLSVYSEITVPSYQITKTGADKSLQRTEAVFVFTFTRGGGKPVQREIKISYNNRNETIKPDSKGNYSLKTKPGKYVFQFYHSRDFYEIKTDSVEIKPAFKTHVLINFQSSEIPVICDKPVIYLYPKKTMPVCLVLDVKGSLDFTYPEYKRGWDFIVDKDGTIYKGDKTYNYLFWDGSAKIDQSKINMNEGFIVNKDNNIKFFEEKLGQMGLNSKEIEDYITYWCPRMNANKQNYVHFLFNDECNEYAELNITPKPDKLFRVFMLWAPVENNIAKIKDQSLESFSRNGFTVLEWGGAEMKSNLKNL